MTKSTIVTRVSEEFFLSNLVSGAKGDVDGQTDSARYGVADFSGAFAV